ncbi:MAG: hypothetical protein ACJ71W_17850 [Terriglobales bacterium]
MSSETDPTFDESFRRRVSEHAYGAECEQAGDLAAALEPENADPSVSTSPALPNYANGERDWDLKTLVRLQTSG